MASSSTSKPNSFNFSFINSSCLRFCSSSVIALAPQSSCFGGMSNPPHDDATLPHIDSRWSSPVFGWSTSFASKSLCLLLLDLFIAATEVSTFTSTSNLSTLSMEENPVSGSCSLEIAFSRAWWWTRGSCVCFWISIASSRSRLRDLNCSLISVCCLSFSPSEDITRIWTLGFGLKSRPRKLCRSCPDSISISFDMSSRSSSRETLVFRILFLDSTFDSRRKRFWCCSSPVWPVSLDLFASSHCMDSLKEERAAFWNCGSHTALDRRLRGFLSWCSSRPSASFLRVSTLSSNSSLFDLDADSSSVSLTRKSCFSFWDSISSSRSRSSDRNCSLRSSFCLNFSSSSDTFLVWNIGDNTEKRDKTAPRFCSWLGVAWSLSGFSVSSRCMGSLKVNAVFCKTGLCISSLKISFLGCMSLFWDLSFFIFEDSACASVMRDSRVLRWLSIAFSFSRSSSWSERSWSLRSSFCLSFSASENSPFICTVRPDSLDAISDSFPGTTS